MAYQVPSSKSPRSTTGITSSSPSGSSKGSNNSSWLKGLVTLIVIIILIGGGIYLIADFIGISLPGGGAMKLQGDWQAIFLTNGQVYFGKIAKIDSEIIALNSIYYLQVVTQPLQRSAEGETPPQQPEQRLTLIKLGNEIHGPMDEMMINRDHVIIIEDLKNDSRVVQAINDYIANQ